MIRHRWIDPGESVAVVQQCALAGLCRATVYAQRRPPVVDASDLVHSRLIDEEYTRHPFYGTRRMVIFLEKAGHTVNRKRVRRLMRLMGLSGMAPGPNTSRPRPEHPVYPYLLRRVPVVRPNQVWSTDITYIRLIASILNRMGRHTPDGRTWTAVRARATRNNHAIAVYREGERQARGELSVSEVAAILSVTQTTVLRMIRLRHMPATQACVNAPWLVRQDDLDRHLADHRPAGRPQTSNPNQLSMLST